jgi:hypothetical protein
VTGRLGKEESDIAVRDGEKLNITLIISEG